MSYRVTALLLLLTLPLAAATGLAAARSGEEEVPADIKAAHEKLREALKEIRGYHGTGAHSYAGVLPFGEVDFEYADFKRVRLGVVVDSHPAGARITGVTPGSPADEADLLSGDIITHINGEPITDDRRRGLGATTKLLRQVSRLEDGEEVRITYLRDDESAETTAAARKMEAEPFLFYSTEHDPDQVLHSPPRRLLHSGSGEILLDDWRQPFAWLNMELVELNPELGEYFGADEGVLVISGPDKDDLDIRAGDVILEIDGREVKSPAHTMRILRSYETGESLSIDLLRHRKELKIDTTVPEPRRPSSGLIVDF
jgi:S1-C subfamily serine protease